MKLKLKLKKPNLSRKKLILLLAIVLLLIVAAAAALFFLRGRGEGEEPVEELPEPIEAPLTYAVAETEFPALPVMSEEILVYQEFQEEPEEEAPADGEEETTQSDEEAAGGEAETAEGDEEPAEEEGPTIQLTAEALTYRYEGFSDPGSIVSAYTTLLNAGNSGFFFVDEELVKLEESPDFEAVTGIARLARDSATEGTLLYLQFDWSAGICRVVVDTPQGKVKNPPPPPGTNNVPPPSMTYGEALDYVHGLSPAAFGLPGASMADYRFYFADGAVMVNDIPCIRVGIYSISEKTGTNVAEGSYYLASDRSHIFKLDVATGAISEVVDGALIPLEAAGSAAP